MTNLRQAIDRIRRSEAGASVPEAIIAVVLSALAMAFIAAALFSVSAFQVNLDSAADDRNARTHTESAFRSSVQRAFLITVTDGKKVSFARSDTVGTCRSDAWSIVTTDSGRTDLTRTITRYDTPISAYGCTGTPRTTATISQRKDISASSSFQYRNIGGRTMGFSGGTSALSTTETKPSTVAQPKWDSSTVKYVTLNAEYTYAGKTTPFRVAQDATHTPSYIGSPDGPSYFNAP